LEVFILQTPLNPIWTKKPQEEEEEEEEARIFSFSFLLFLFFLSYTKMYNNS